MKAPTLALLALFTLGALTVSAQPKKPISPHETISAEIDGAKISVSYGRPYTKDPKTGEPRKIWGGLVPYEQVWRTGANEATVLTTDKELVFTPAGKASEEKKSNMDAGTHIPAGSYSLWTIPKQDGSATLIFNKQTGEWGTKHDKSQDFATVELNQATLDQPVHQFTMSLEKNDGKSDMKGGGVLSLSWEDRRFYAPFQVQP